jgi:hypothetical protein
MAAWAPAIVIFHAAPSLLPRKASLQPLEQRYLQTDINDRIWFGPTWTANSVPETLQG